jgi:predicted acylesterase/phospholipase RssA
MQVGVIHALLTADYDPPDVVTGVSAGAISAVALAEILQAGNGANKHAAQVLRFREVLEAYRDGPLQLLMAQLPDGYETSARQATKNLQLPIHLQVEREGREQAQRAESGLIRLLNEVFAIDMPVRQAVLLTRIALGIREAGECSSIWLQIYEFGLLYFRLLRNLGHLSLPVGRIVLILLKPSDDPPEPCSARKVLFRKHRLKRRWNDGLRTFVGETILVLLPLIAPLALFGRYLKPKTKGKTRDRLKHCLQVLMPQTWWDRFFSTRAGEECFRAVLSHYALAKELGNANALRQLFVEVFDQNYFGALNMVQVAEAALKRSTNPLEPQLPATPKTLQDFAGAAMNMTVAVFAADIDKFRVRPVPSETAVVDALMAATAIVPVFRAVGLPVFKEKDVDGNEIPPPKGTVFYIDGENVNADPLRPTVKFLQTRINYETSAVRFYSAVAFPISKSELPSERQYRGLVRVATRSLELQRMQNALLERNFIKLYHDILQVAFEQEKRDRTLKQAELPQGKSEYPRKAVLRRASPDGDEKGENKPLIAGRVVPIDTDVPLRLNEKILGASSHEGRRALIDQAVADGCRATLTAWLSQPDEPLSETAQQLRQSEPRPRFISCRELIAAHLKRTRPSDPALAHSESDVSKGPGLSEICVACRFFQDRVASDGKTLPKLDGFDLGKTVDSTVPNAGADSNSSTPATSSPLAIEPSGRPTKEPTVSLLFSGGVFRGVYQIGVANALLALQLRPNVVAGASVGSITAALVAEIFSDDCAFERRRSMCRLATSFLALDRLILTDRFYDFVRRITLRGGNAEFSPRDVDLLLRRYDEGSTAFSTARARRTMAGLERVLYLSPFELHELIRNQRLQNYTELYRLLVNHLQELLDRNGASLEILGAEPLILLLKEHLLRRHDRSVVQRFNLYAKKDGQRNIHLLATVTNLTKGYLRTLGSPYVGDKEWPVLRDGLLASSAFPGVFRPRNSWEIFPTSSNQDQYVDGGVMDNLPFASVVSFLDEASKPRHEAGRDPIYVRRPRAPHLIVTGSLEPNCHKLGPIRTNQVRKCWVTLRKRAGQIAYNRKIHDFEVAERDVRSVWRRTGLSPGARSDEPLHIEVVAVKPEWLCGTFAFHPMLGFSRRRQAASIAHGCAGTLKKMKALWQDSPTEGGEKYFWEMDQSIAQHITDEIIPNRTAGGCWFCSKLMCPFSKSQLDELDQKFPEEKLPPATRKALISIYKECGKAETHPDSSQEK